MYFVLLFLSILPVYLLGTYIYKNDFDKEPTKLIFKLFFLGIGSAFLTILITKFLILAVPMFGYETTSLDPISLIPYTFIGVALVEEFSKWIFVYTTTYRVSDFNHAYDAIVYSVFVALGFACIENVLYVFGTYEISTAVTRALLAVPGHVADGIFMGYFLALAKISETNGNLELSKKNKLKSIIIPVIAHGIYDYLLFVSPFFSISILFFFIFVYFIFNKALDLVAQMKKLRMTIAHTFNNGITGTYNTNTRVDYNYNSQLFTNPNVIANYCEVCGARRKGNFCSNCGKKYI